MDLPSDKDYSNEKFRGSEEIVLERELCFGKVSSASNGALKIQDFGLSLKRVTLKASGGGKESEVVLVDKTSDDGDGDQVLVGGGEVLLAVNGTDVSGMAKEEVERALAETAEDNITVRVRLFTINIM